MYNLFCKHPSSGLARREPAVQGLCFIQSVAWGEPFKSSSRALTGVFLTPGADDFGEWLSQ